MLHGSISSPFQIPPLDYLSFVASELRPLESFPPFSDSKIRGKLQNCIVGLLPSIVLWEPGDDHNEVCTEYNRMTTEYNEVSTDYNEVSTEYNEVSTEYNEVSTDYNKVSTEYNKVSTEYY